jgi:thiamine-phosphate pyrophosphorylase
MIARQRPWPRAWLMTDERMGERLWTAIDRLPAGSGIVFRHYSMPPDTRAMLAERIAEFCHRQGLTLAVAGDAGLARSIGADLVHNPTRSSGLPFSRSIHSMAESETAKAEGASLVFVSAVFATRSHPGREPLGVAEATEIARAAAVPAIALGGMTAPKFTQLEREGFYGWAGIDGWLGEDGVRT